MRWWYSIDTYFQTNILFFDDTTKYRVAGLNQLVFDQTDSLVLHKSAGLQYKHDLKQPLVNSCDSVLSSIKRYLEGHFQFDRVKLNDWI